MKTAYHLITSGQRTIGLGKKYGHQLLCESKQLSPESAYIIGRNPKYIDIKLKENNTLLGRIIAAVTLLIAVMNLIFIIRTLFLF